MKTSHLLLLTLPLGLLSACTVSTRQAPVIERTAPGAETPFKPAPPTPPPAVEEAPKPEVKGLYTVKKGDTLIQIALNHGQHYRDIAAWNSLANPDDIKVDQVLRVLPPEGGMQTTPVPLADTRPVPAPTPAVPKKSTPRGEKKPYSESALAEMQKADGGKPEAKAADAAPSAAAAAAAATPAPVAALPTPTPLAADDEKLSWMWPAEGKVVATFDEGKSKGIDIAGKPGQQVMAAGAGKVQYAGSGIRGYGNLVIVKHSNSLLSAYAHNRAIVVKEGQTVTKGQQIAEMGDSDADSVKLHFEIRHQGKPVDPSKFLPTR